MSLAVLRSRALAGMEAPAVSVEVHLANGLPAMAIAGWKAPIRTLQGCARTFNAPTLDLYPHVPPGLAKHEHAFLLFSPTENTPETRCKPPRLHSEIPP